MKKRMRFLAVAALSLAMTTAFGQQGSSGTQSGSTGTQSGSSGSGQYDQNKSGTQSQGVQSTQPGTSTQSVPSSSTQSGQGSGMNQTQSGQSGKSSTGTSTQSGKSTQSGTSTQSGKSTQSGQGTMGSAEDRVTSEVSWMKSQFNLDQDQERRLHDVLLKYENQGTTGQGASATKNQEEKDKEIKAIIGDSNFQVYKKHEAEKKSGSKGTYEKSSSTKSTKSTTKTPDKSKK